MYNSKGEALTHEQIARRAYQIYLERGFQPGNELGDWLAAEQELTEPQETADMNRPPTRAVSDLRNRVAA
jgi:hypothetical protein